MFHRLVALIFSMSNYAEGFCHLNQIDLSEDDLKSLCMRVGRLNPPLYICLQWSFLRPLRQILRHNLEAELAIKDFTAQPSSLPNNHQDPCMITSPMEVTEFHASKYLPWAMIHDYWSGTLTTACETVEIDAMTTQ